MASLKLCFPKGTDFNLISDDELKSIQDELNNRPRKRSFGEAKSIRLANAKRNISATLKALYLKLQSAQPETLIVNQLSSLPHAYLFAVACPKVRSRLLQKVAYTQTAEISE